MGSRDAEAAPGPRPAARRRGGFAVLVAAGILLSRLAGLVRERVFAHYLGSSRAADAFKAALKVPNFLQNLFGEGVLSASFIPVYAKLLADGDAELADRVAGVFVSLLALCVAVLVLLGVVLAPWLLDAIAPGFEGEVRDLTVHIVRILFPGVGLLVLSAWCLGVLNSHHRFFLSYVAPVLWNLAMIVTLVAFGARLAQVDLVIALSWGTVVGSALQLLVQLPWVIRSAPHLVFGLDRSLEPVREIGRNLGPVVVGRGVVQLSAYVDQMIASYLPAGAVAGLAYAQTLYLLPISLFGMSVAAAELPQMSRQTGSRDAVHAVIRARLERGLRQVAFFVIPSAVAFVALGRLLVAALYQTGAFGEDQTRYVWYILVGSTVGMFAMTQGRLYSSAFYALRDTRTPLRFATIRVALTAALGVLLAFPLRWTLVALVAFLGLPLPASTGGAAAMGTVGLTASAGVAGWLEFLLLRGALQRRIGPVAFPVPAQVRLWAAAVAAALLALAVDVLGGAALAQRLPLAHVARALVAAGAFGTAYLGATMALGVPEARATLGRLARR